ncbi:hypothetical protein [Microbacterium soli]|uniref:MFS transporter n=1 Tax=Microbacterium soli TaxID=446075 RepID=A0ABP7N8M4_9MICO
MAALPAADRRGTLPSRTRALVAREPSRDVRPTGRGTRFDDRLGIWRDPVARQVAEYMGVQSTPSGMSPSVGYAIAAIGPTLFGALHAASGSRSGPLVTLLVVTALQSVLGAYAGRDRFVLGHRS